MFTIAAVAVMGGALFGSTFTAQLNAVAFDVSGANALQKIEEMGGIELVMPGAFAEMGDCDSAEFQGRTVVEFPLTGVSITLPTGLAGDYNAMTFSEQIPGPTLRVTPVSYTHLTLPTKLLV